MCIDSSGIAVMSDTLDEWDILEVFQLDFFQAIVTILIVTIFCCSLRCFIVSVVVAVDVADDVAVDVDVGVGVSLTRLYKYFQWHHSCCYTTYITFLIYRRIGFIRAKTTCLWCILYLTFSQKNQPSTLFLLFNTQKIFLTSHFHLRFLKISTWNKMKYKATRPQ